MAERQSRCEEWKPLMAMLGVDLVFAVVNILLKKVLDQGMNHLVLVTYRLSISAVFLAPIAYFSERNSRPKLTLGILCSLFLSAIVGASLTQYLFLLGIQYTSATFACAFVNMVPVFTFLMALPFRLESVNFKCNSGRAKVAGTLVCIAGAFVLTLYRGASLFDSSRVANGTVENAFGLSPAKTTQRWTIGTVSLSIGTLSWSSWFLLQSNIGRRYPCQYSTTAIMSFFAAIQSAIFSFSANRHPSVNIWVLRGWTQIITVLFSGMVGSGLGYVTMSWCVKKKGPVFTAAFSPLVQVMAAMIDIPFLHEPLYLGSLIGSMMVIIGLYILLWGKKKEMESFESKLCQQTEHNKAEDTHLNLSAVTVTCESRPS